MTIGLKLLQPVSDITPMSSLPSLHRIGRRSTLTGATSHLRLDASPPSLRHAPGTLWERILFWLLAPAPHEAAPPLNRLPSVRGDFLAAIGDVGDDEAAAVRAALRYQVQALRQRIQSARSLRELWHLRAEVFRIVGLAYDQGEAERRLLTLNRHFPVRPARRSQFGGL